MTFVGLFCLLVLLPLGILSFELLRVNFAREQLQANVDSAALAATAALTSTSAQSDAPGKVALEIYKRNSILEYPLKNAYLVADVDRAHVYPGSSAISVHFLDQNGNNSGSNANRPTRRVQVKGVLGYKPPFAQYLGLGNYELRAVARAGLPKIDLALVLDVSNSMTYKTKSLYVKRYSVGRGTTPNDPNLKNMYQVVGREGDFDPGDDYFCEVDETSGLSNPVPGQMLRKTRIGDLEFDPELRNPKGNQATPPGNIKVKIVGGSKVFDSDESVADNNKIYTDMIAANILSTDPIPGDPTNSHNLIFPDIATVVEASRGNLDNLEAYTKSHAEASGVRRDLVGIATKAKYEELTYQTLQPWQDANQLTKNFVRFLGNSSDVHFGLIPFATLAAQSPEEPNGTKSIKDNIISAKYNPPDLGAKGDGIGEFRLMQVPLRKNRSGVNAVINELGQLHHHYGTNTADALNEARKMIVNKNHYRPDARRAVVMITDGLPVFPGEPLVRLNNIPADRQHREMESDTYRIAKQIGEDGVPIYTIGFLQPGAAAKGSKVLGQIAIEAGHGSKFYLAENLSELKKALDYIERDLISLTN